MVSFEDRLQLRKRGFKSDSRFFRPSFRAIPKGQVHDQNPCQGKIGEQGNERFGAGILDLLNKSQDSLRIFIAACLFPDSVIQPDSMSKSLSITAAPQQILLISLYHRSAQDQAWITDRTEQQITPSRPLKIQLCRCLDTTDPPIR